jgi:hypothetical protein
MLVPIVVQHATSIAIYAETEVAVAARPLMLARVPSNNGQSSHRRPRQDRRQADGNAVRMDGSTTRALSKRRWRQFSLRGLLALVLICCVGLGLLAHRARHQRQVIEDLEALGVEVQATELPASTAWLRNLLGDDLLGIRYTASLRNGPTPQQFENLQQLPRLDSVSVEYDNSMAESEIDSKMTIFERELPNTSISLSGRSAGQLWTRSKYIISCYF